MDVLRWPWSFYPLSECIFWTHYQTLRFIRTANQYWIPQDKTVVNNLLSCVNAFLIAPIKISSKRIVNLSLMKLNDHIYSIHPCNVSVDLSPAFHGRGLDSITGQSVWNLWYTKWQRDRFYSACLYFLVSIIPLIIFTPVSFINHHRCTVGAVVAWH